MKNIYRAVLIAGLFAQATIQLAAAQQTQRAVEFQAPFAFQVESTKLPAGEYTILEQTGWVQIQTKGGKNAAQVLTIPVVNKDQKAAANSRVVFRNYGGQMFLAEIWATGQEKGRELLETKEEQQLARKEKLTRVIVPGQSVAAK